MESLINAPMLVGQVLCLALLVGCAVHGVARLIYLLAPEDEGRG